MNYRTDANNEPAKEVRSWNGIPLNITTKTGEPRFSFAPPMSCDYGCIRGSWGAGLDGKALDVYVVSDAPTVFKVVQITPAGAIDEYKYVLGARDFDEAVETFLKHVPRQLFGAASQYSISQLQDDIGSNSKVKRDADEVAVFVEQLEELIESDDAYSSNVYVMSFEIAESGDISGKFKDAWNGRIFTYSVEKSRIGYKPALTLDRVDSASAKLFDVFSAGYASLTTNTDAIKNGKKPRCTAVSYSCGKICLSLQNTCWINSAGQKVKKAGGAVASISQGRIDKLRTLARYLAANGNNKWSKYGTSKKLESKANLLEKQRANLFKRKANSAKKTSNFNFPPYDAKTRQLPPEYKLIGDGISGNVYLDKRDSRNPKALKYAKATDEPLTINAAKAMGDLGIAPKVYGAIFEEGKVNAIAMEYLDGYKTLGGGSDLYKEEEEEEQEFLQEKESDLLVKNILKITKIAHDNGFTPPDMHQENLMYNPKTFDVKFIDVDDSARDSYKGMATQLLGHQESWRPMLAQKANWYASTKIPKKDYKEFKKLQDAVARSLDNQGSRENPAASPDKAGKDNFSEDQYKEIVEKAYKLLGID
ncbi:hypothetical protein [Microcoleus sp. Pol12B5]|uniref:hypothetical protein n=1 Tax=Microcoleus sp. Pol12B5 TaxID=3055396 RepID=UPI002FD41334